MTSTSQIMTGIKLLTGITGWFQTCLPLPTVGYFISHSVHSKCAQKEISWSWLSTLFSCEEEIKKISFDMYMNIQRFFREIQICCKFNHSNKMALGATGS